MDRASRCVNSVKLTHHDRSPLTGGHDAFRLFFSGMKIMFNFFGRAPAPAPVPAAPVPVLVLPPEEIQRLGVDPEVSDDGALRDAVIAWDWGVARCAELKAKLEAFKQHLATEYGAALRIEPEPGLHCDLQQYTLRLQDSIETYLRGNRDRLLSSGSAVLAGRIVSLKENPPAVDIGDEKQWLRSRLAATHFDPLLQQKRSLDEDLQDVLARHGVAGVVRIEVKPDKVGIKKRLESGKKVSGACLVTTERLVVEAR